MPHLPADKAQHVQGVPPITKKSVGVEEATLCQVIPDQKDPHFLCGQTVGCTVLLADMGSLVI